MIQSHQKLSNLIEEDGNPNYDYGVEVNIFQILEVKVIPYVDILSIIACFHSRSHSSQCMQVMAWLTGDIKVPPTN